MEPISAKLRAALVPAGKLNVGARDYNGIKAFANNHKDPLNKHELCGTLRFCSKHNPDSSKPFASAVAACANMFHRLHSHLLLPKDSAHLKSVSSPPMLGVFRSRLR